MNRGINIINPGITQNITQSNVANITAAIIGPNTYEILVPKEAIPIPVVLISVRKTSEK